MKQTVIVRKNPGHRVFLRILSLAAAGLCLWLGPLAAVCALPWWALTLWEAGWSITFTPEQIVYKTLFRQKSRHSYSQITDLRLRYYSGEKVACLFITFSDHTGLKLRMDCENADRAKRLLTARHSIN